VASFKDDTDLVKREYEGLSNSTQIFIWSLVALGVLLGLLLGGAIAYGVAVEEQDGRDCIEYEGELYCADGGAAETEGEAEDG
jgi:hypothetical protein